MRDEGIDEVFFKKANGGWLFKLGSPFIFGKPDYFFVTDLQKAALAEKLRSNRLIRLGIVLPGILVTAPAALSLPIPKTLTWMVPPASFLEVYALFVLAAQIGCHRLCPLVKTALRAEERSALTGQFRIAAQYTSFSVLLLLFAIFAANLVLAIAVIGHRDILPHAAGLILYGMAALYYGSLIAVKLVTKQYSKGFAREGRRDRLLL